jgi:predicted nucleotidyltransferase component of viral defense system
MTEKLRSLLSRQQPRDFYDLWYLSEVEGMEMRDYIVEFEAKTRHKGLSPGNLEIRIEKILPTFKSRWESSKNK